MGDINNERMIAHIKSIMNEGKGFEWDSDVFYHINTGWGMERIEVGELLLYLIENR